MSDYPGSALKRQLACLIRMDVADQFDDLAKSRGETAASLIRAFVYRELGREQDPIWPVSDPWFAQLQTWAERQVIGFYANTGQIAGWSGVTVGEVSVQDCWRVGSILGHLGWKRRKGGWRKLG